MKATNNVPKLIQLFLACSLIAASLTAAMAIQEYGKLRAMERDSLDSVQVIESPVPH